MTNSGNWDALLRCGETSGDATCGLPLEIKPSLIGGAIYVCSQGHQLGAVEDVDAYVLAVVLGAISRPKERWRFPAMQVEEGPRAFAAWWDDASAEARHDVMAAAIDHVSVAPSSKHALDTEPMVVIFWKEDLPSKVEEGKR
jgi:hypothetical protein